MSVTFNNVVFGGEGRRPQPYDTSTSAATAANTGIVERADAPHYSYFWGIPVSLVIKVSSSEPRDVLQSERTCLTFIRFATSLFFTALGVVLNFQLRTDNGEVDPIRHVKDKFSHAISLVLIVLSFFTLSVSGVNYFKTVNRYAKGKIQTYNFNNVPTVICITSVVITLMVILISLIIERYISEE